jgi:hypothetical protein
MSGPTTYYRLGAGDRIVAATVPAPAPRARPLSAADVQRVHPLALQAAIALAGGDLSRLVFTAEGTVEVRNTPRENR